MSENHMETYFNIRYEFDRERVFRRMDEVLRSGGAGYICVADGHVLSEVQRNREYRNVLNGALLTICDSGWVPVYLKWLLHADRPQYCGAQIFSDAIGMKKYRMMFLGGSRETLDALRRTLEREDPRVKHMPFQELPFCPVDEFDYAAIAGRINEYLPDIVWVSLGAPKQEIFMNRLCPHLQRGVMVAVGAVFNFASGRNIRRAPAWMVDCRLEFLYRIFSEPRKQMKRCWKIISVLPWIFIREKTTAKGGQAGCRLRNGRKDALSSLHAGLMFRPASRQHGGPAGGLGQGRRQEIRHCERRCRVLEPALQCQPGADGFLRTPVPGKEKTGKTASNQRSGGPPAASAAISGSL